MLDSGTYILIGMREWVDEAGHSRQADDKNVKYCDLLEVYNSMERDILRRTHNVFGSLKDESGKKYDDRNTNVMFVDENTLKYQKVIKKMDENADGDDSDDGEVKEQATVITTTVKHIGKGVIVQSYDISDDDRDDGDEDGDEDGGGDGDDDSDSGRNSKVATTIQTGLNKNKNTNIEYTVETNINVDDI